MRELKIVEYKGKRVLTTAQSAEFLETEADLITRNFNRNKEHYEIGEDYFFLEGKELKDFASVTVTGANLSKIRSLYLWTFNGCLIHYNNLRSASLSMLYQFADYFGVDASSLAIVKHRCQESLLGEQLKNLLQDICPIIPQLTVDRYRVDFYLPAISVVIEYDEQHHKHQSKEDLQRQNYIEDRLGCTFIRVQSGYDFSLIANKIMIALLKSKR